MAVIGIDDTDSRTEGMCTTWIGTEVAARLPPERVDTLFLIRLNPAVKHKTRGNGAVAIRTTGDLEVAMATASSVIEEFAVLTDPQTNPGLVGLEDAAEAPDALRTFARQAVRGHHTRADARAIVTATGATAETWGTGRGLIGAAAAIGAVARPTDRRPHDPVFGDWTYEWLAYRERDRWGTRRSVEIDPVRASLPDRKDVWDTVDSSTDEVICAPHSPCPVLFGIRGDTPRAVQAVGNAIAGEPVDRGHLFLTNQGTDGHLQPGSVGELADGHAYRVCGKVHDGPTTWEGGHVAVELQADQDTIQCLAFAPTGRFRDRVRALVPGDRVIACGEVSDGALKLEKFALVRRVLTEHVTPTCPACDRTMESAGRGQGYRCRPCGTAAPHKVVSSRERAIEPGWYEVPPGARRHLAKPLVRGGYDLPVHPTSV